MCATSLHEVLIASGIVGVCVCVCKNQVPEDSPLADHVLPALSTALAAFAEGIASLAERIATLGEGIASLAKRITALPEGIASLDTVNRP